MPNRRSVLRELINTGRDKRYVRRDEKGQCKESDVGNAAMAGPATSSRAATVAGMVISHPERVVYPDQRITKIDVARYYAAIGDWIVPHVAGRPLTLVHCPQGLNAPCNYLRHRAVWGPAALRRVKIQEKTKLGEYLIADDIKGVVGLAQMGVLEIHTWNSTDEDIERPDRIVWDLDPGNRVSWAAVVAAAVRVRDVLAVVGLQTWVKTTGGRGLHVVMPIARHRDWSECLAFARNIAQALERADAAAYTTAFPKAGRASKILIDYLRNNRTNTSVAAYSTRARPGATVSVPTTWDELITGIDPARFTIKTVAERLMKVRRDPWSDYWTCKQRISAAAARAIASAV